MRWPWRPQLCPAITIVAGPFNGSRVEAMGGQSCRDEVVLYRSPGISTRDPEGFQRPVVAGVR